MKAYSVQLRFDDRRLGPSGRTIRVQASGQAAAIGKAVRDFMRGLTRKERRDAQRKLTAVSVLLRELQDAPAGARQMVDRPVEGRRA